MVIIFLFKEGFTEQPIIPGVQISSSQVSRYQVSRSQVSKSQISRSQVSGSYVSGSQICKFLDSQSKQTTFLRKHKLLDIILFSSVYYHRHNCFSYIVKLQIVDLVKRYLKCFHIHLNINLLFVRERINYRSFNVRIILIRTLILGSVKNPGFSSIPIFHLNTSCFPFSSFFGLSNVLIILQPKSVMLVSHFVFSIQHACGLKHLLI